jgi:uroporphyrinogen decarboxylase
MPSKRENYLRAVEFRNPEWIPVSVNLPNAVWRKYREELEDIVLGHPILFEGYKKGSKNFDEVSLNHHEKGKEYYRDEWGCIWYNLQEGLEGQVVGHPLADWKALATFQPPDPLVGIDWNKIKEKVGEDRRKGLLTRGEGGRFFDRLQFLRGFENLMMDLATDPPELSKLIELVLENNMSSIIKWLEIGVDVMGFHSDIGTQRGLMISPKMFRKYVKPAYKKMFTACRNAGPHVYYSSDGNLLEIVDDLIECGVSIHDPQLRACTLEGIAKVYKGKMCINLDLDEQMFAFCKPADIREQVRKVVEKLWLPQGGLMVYGEPSPDVPLENIEAICSALEEFRFYHR